MPLGTYSKNEMIQKQDSNVSIIKFMLKKYIPQDGAGISLSFKIKWQLTQIF